MLSKRGDNMDKWIEDHTALTMLIVAIVGLTAGFLLF